MKAYIFSIGESTTKLCTDLMWKYGFEVVLLKDDTTLWEKLKRFYTEALATDDEIFARIDADVIPNKNAGIIPKYQTDYPFWECAVGYDWYKQDRGPISIHYMNRKAVEIALDNIEKAENEIRPETYLWRLSRLNPYTQIDWTLNRGIHGYGQKDQRERIMKLKHSRGQEYDWSLVERIENI